MAETKRKRLGDMLMEVGLITKEQLQQALQIQTETDKLLGQVLTENNFVSENQIIEMLEKLMGIPRLQLDTYYVDPLIPPMISETLAKKYELIPVKKDGNKIIVAMTDPMNIFAIDDIQTATGLIVEPNIATRADVSKAIGLYYGKQKAERAIEDFYKENELLHVAADTDRTDDNLQNAPIVRLVNTIIAQAVRSAASDIHIEPFEDEVIFRIRIDGTLQQVLSSAKSTHAAVVARIKIISRLDIAEKRLAQDGRFEMVVEGTRVDMRISILPTVFGEKVVIRLLYRSNTLISKSNLGFSEKNLAVFNKIIKSPVGLILVTGPTGSGKSTTLYTILEELNTVEKNIVTVEDPVEYMIKGISQVQVSNKVGMTFPNSLATILRQDPDVIMVGEMRDSETCEIAVRAAITGHLVFSTMHTNDTAATVTRLIDMGVEPFLASTALVGVVAQRLVRRICPLCKTEISQDEADMNALNINADEMRFFKGAGCVACRNTGFNGRIAVHEILPVTKEIRKLIINGADADSIRDTAISQGMITLRQSCLELVRNGITTLEEAIRIAYNIE